VQPPPPKVARPAMVVPQEFMNKIRKKP